MTFRKMTDEEQLQRLAHVADWDPVVVERLRTTCAEKGFNTPAQILAYAQQVSDNECLSALRGGDRVLDAMVAEAFRVPVGTSSKDLAWAARTVANEDYLPWADVERAKKMLDIQADGLTDEEKAEYAKVTASSAKLKRGNSFGM